MKTLFLSIVILLLISCTKENVSEDSCPVCNFQSSKEQLKSQTVQIRTQDNYFIWSEKYRCKNCGADYELFKKAKVQK
jgi:ssDNA-binding Zn-finger/Zn-ribbon topoisomerase 1